MLTSEQKLAYEMEDINKEIKSIPFKINWNNPEIGKAWFILHYEDHDYYSIIMGIEGITKGWKLDLTKLNSGFKDQVPEHTANELMRDLNNWVEHPFDVCSPWWFTEKDINKYMQLCDLFYENRATFQGKREYLTEYQLQFLDE